MSSEKLASCSGIGDDNDDDNEKNKEEKKEHGQKQEESDKEDDESEKSYETDDFVDALPEQEGTPHPTEDQLQDNDHSESIEETSEEDKEMSSDETVENEREPSVRALSGLLDHKLGVHEKESSVIHVEIEQLPPLPPSPIPPAVHDSAQEVGHDSVQEKAISRGASQSAQENKIPDRVQLIPEAEKDSLNNGPILDNPMSSSPERLEGDLSQTPPYEDNAGESAKNLRQTRSQMNDSAEPSPSSDRRIQRGDSSSSSSTGSSSLQTPSTDSGINNNGIAETEGIENSEIRENDGSPNLVIRTDSMQSLFKSIKLSPSMVSPPIDVGKNGDALFMKLEKEMKKSMRESAGRYLCKPSAQSNSRSAYRPPEKFITMEEVLGDQSPLDLSDSPKSMTDERREAFQTMSDEQKKTFRWLSVIEELVETEETYTRDLFILCTHFFKILQSVPFVTKEEQEQICRNGEDIARDQENFCEALKLAARRDKEGGSVKHIASCFIEWEAYFESYSDYSIGQDDAIATYNKLVESNDKFRDLNERLHFFHRISWGTNKLKFEDYLIMPFQRLFRYKLLLQTLEKATPTDLEGFELLSIAERIIHNVATRINDSKARLELEKKTEIFLTRLQADWCLPKRWFKHLGTCSLIGTLEMRYLPKQRSSKRVCCALFEHYVILARPKRSDTYESKHWFPIREFTVEDLPDIPTSVHFPWLLRSNSHVFEFSAVSEAEKDIWMTSMIDCIESAKEHYIMSRRDANKYLVEHLFVSSLDPRIKKIMTEEPHEIDLDTTNQPVHIPIPSGSASFSQSAIFNKPARNNHRLSIPNFSTMFYSSGDHAQSPSTARYLFGGTLTDKFANYKLKQFKTRCDAFDANFRDVYENS
ncbi:hypothetical protein RO3G_02064 [Rhizopus delemar RA 99-880]|uniref:DH domain-containing protein n=1 Tax=Rhizopus delemar (strain RA 99-880 / ATCC MYA-4621 / FGSC 9543 / NRRL 43880) TaxID=246409 RepID=I1BMD0_RHIO9|nr:hypothetical protein RO3G_02064 [Rhizopus delemar RA 99-880]|eukprot:EIE77360.1 hypothetical protein RO3G_02064 [Rhizopus delemar RA 99-880]